MRAGSGMSTVLDSSSSVVDWVVVEVGLYSFLRDIEHLYYGVLVDSRYDLYAMHMLRADVLVDD